MKWGVGCLLHLMGVGSRGTHRTALSPQWKALTTQIGDAYTGVLLKRFGRYCTAHKIGPHDVSDAIADAFGRSLELELRVANARRAHRETIRLWNRMVTSDGSWPKRSLTLPSYSPKYVLDWNAFPASLANELEQYLAKQATSDPFDLSTPVRALKASSVATYRNRILRFASCLVLTGTDVSELRSISDLVRPQAIERGLRYLAYERRAKPLAGAIGFVLAI